MGVRLIAAETIRAHEEKTQWTVAVFFGHSPPLALVRVSRRRGDQHLPLCVAELFEKRHEAPGQFAPHVGRRVMPRRYARRQKTSGMI